jgi:hypothetical protein
MYFPSPSSLFWMAPPNNVRVAVAFFHCMAGSNLLCRSLDHHSGECGWVCRLSRRELHFDGGGNDKSWVDWDRSFCCLYACCSAFLPTVSSPDSQCSPPPLQRISPLKRASRNPSKASTTFSRRSLPGLVILVTPSRTANPTALLHFKGGHDWED